MIFSTDVPPGGQTWSLRLWGGYSGTAEVQTTIPLANPDSATRYILSYWAKGHGNAGLILLTPQMLQYGAAREFIEDSWVQFSDTLVSAQSGFDSLRIYLSRALFDTTKVALFDNIQVIEILP